MFVERCLEKVFEILFRNPSYIHRKISTHLKYSDFSRDHLVLFAAHTFENLKISTTARIKGISLLK